MPSPATQTATLHSSIINLLNTIIGAGLLALPLSFKTDGILLGILIIAVAGITSGFGLYLQGLSSKFIRNGDANFFNICSITYPSLSLLFDVAIAVQCFGVGLSYIVLIGDLMPSVVSIDVGDERLFWIIASLAATVPLVSLRNLDSLKYTSVVALLAIVYMVCLVYAHFVLHVTGLSHDDTGPIRWVQPKSLTSVMSTFSIVVFAYTGHQNMYSIINELHDNSVHRVLKIAYISIPITGVLFVSIALSGYLTFGDNVGGNVILLYSDNVFSKIGRSAIVLMVLLSYPLMFHPCRISVNNMVFWCQERFVRRGAAEEPESGGLLDAAESQAAAEPHAARRPTLGTTRFAVVTAALLAASYLLAISLSSFQFILSVVGATGSTAISFILPGLFGYRLVASAESSAMAKVLAENSHLDQEADVEHVQRLFNSVWIKRASLALAVWGCIVMVVCLYSSIYLE